MQLSPNGQSGSSGLFHLWHGSFTEPGGGRFFGGREAEVSGRFPRNDEAVLLMSGHASAAWSRDLQVLHQRVQSKPWPLKQYECRPPSFFVQSSVLFSAASWHTCWS